MNQMAAKSSWSLYRRLLGYIKPYKGIFLISVLAMAATALSEMGFAALFKPLIDDGFVERDPVFIAQVPWLIMLVIIIRAIFGFAATYTMAWIGRKVVFDLRKALFERLIYLPATFYDKHSSANLVSKLIYDVEQSATATTDALTLSIKDTLTAVALIAWLMYLDWQLTIVFLVFAPFVAWGVSKASSRFRKVSERIQNSMTGIAQVVKEVVNGHRIVKTFGAQKYETGVFEKANQYNRRQSMRKAAVAAGVVPMLLILFGTALAVVVYLAMNRSGSEQVTAGTFASYLTAALMLMAPLKRLAKVNEKIQMGVAAANSMFAVIDEDKEIDLGTIVLKRVRGGFKFESINFSYHDNERPVLENINLEVASGSTVALVGPSGSGKSTVVALILGFYRPDSGRILLDDRDLAEFTLSSLRENIAIVSQDTTLFDDTIRANVIYGCKSVHEARLQQSLDAAYVSEFLNRMPNGLDTHVGERGSNLSGGQKQRIAIARALYKNAPILILDEATSSLDSLSERLVQQATDNLTKDRTTIVIAHRLSTVEKADQIVVMSQGQIVDRGQHFDLVRRQGLYQQLYESQQLTENHVA